VLGGGAPSWATSVTIEPAECSHRALPFRVHAALPVTSGVTDRTATPVRFEPAPVGLPSPCGIAFQTATCGTTIPCARDRFTAYARRPRQLNLFGCHLLVRDRPNISITNGAAR
jgi:hypothetical protein